MNELINSCKCLIVLIVNKIVDFEWFFMVCVLNVVLYGSNLYFVYDVVGN